MRPEGGWPVRHAVPGASRRAAQAALAGLMLLAGAAAVPAATLIAEPDTLGDGTLSGFTIGFSDRNGNGLVEFDEITGFSGLDQTVDDTLPPRQDFLLAMPQIAGFATAGAVAGLSAPGDVWLFSGTGPDSIETGGPVSGWFYHFALTEPGPGPNPAPVPLLWSGLFATSALAGLAAARRRPGRQAARVT
jgi:hypothetical protein